MSLDAGLGSPLFSRMFQFFDCANEGRLTLAQLLGGLEQFFFGE